MVNVVLNEESVKAWREAKKRRDELREKLKAKGGNPNELDLPQPEIRGTGVIRDRYGNIKGHIVLGPVHEINSSKLEVK